MKNPARSAWLVAVLGAGCGGPPTGHGAGTGVTPEPASRTTQAVTAPITGYRYTLPEFAGTRYTDTVPQTLDLAEMAELSLNALTRTSDPAHEYTLYFLTDWQQNPPVLRHEESSDGNQGKFIAPLVLNRIISGSTEHKDIQEQILNRYLGHVNDTFGHSGASGRVFEGFIYNYLRDHNPVWKTITLQAVQNWCEQLIDMGDWGFWQVDDLDPSSFGAQDPWREEILLMAYTRLGYAPALATLKKHVNFVRRHSGQFDEEGRFFDDHNRHFHVHALYLQAFLGLARLVQDQDLLDFVRRSYEWARSNDAGSVALIGYFPEFVGNQRNSEGCNIADMVTLAMNLSQAGAGDYWDDADRWIRNHFAEVQLTPLKGQQLDAYARATYPLVPVQDFESDRDVSERSVGSFAGWPAVNDFRQRDQRGIQQCCTGNGSRAIFTVWNTIATEDADGGLRVNLLLNRAAAGYDIHSSLPYAGKVEVVLKRDARHVRVRIPGGVTPSQVSLHVNGASREPDWQGRYLDTGRVRDGDVITVEFPNPEATERIKIDGTDYAFTRRGSTVVQVEPAGVIAPLYDRAPLRAGQAPLVEVERFVSRETDLPTRKDSTWKLPVVRVTSSSDDGHGAANLLDGDQDGESRWSTQGRGEWALFKLNREYTVHYVNAAIYNGTQRKQDFKVQVSRDGHHFQTVCTRSSSGATTSLEAYNCRNARGRYVRLVGQERFNAFTEFEIWGTADGDPESLPVRAVRASADDGHGPANTRDGDLSTRWSAPGEAPSIQYELAGLKSVAAVRVAVYRGDQRVQALDIETSTDGDRWTLVSSVKSSGTTRRLETHDVPNIAARYVRIVGRGNTANARTALTEVRIDGYD